MLLPATSLPSPVTYFSKHPGTSLLQMPPEASWCFSIFASKFHLSKAHQKLFLCPFFDDSWNLGSYIDRSTHSHSWRFHKLILLSKIINSYALNIARLVCLLFSVSSDLRGAFNKQWNPEKLSKKKKKKHTQEVSVPINLVITVAEITPRQESVFFIYSRLISWVCQRSCSNYLSLKYEHRVGEGQSLRLL